MHPSRRRLLGGIICSASFGTAGCNTRRSDDDFDPQLDHVVLENYHESSHTVEIWLYAAGESSGSGELVVHETVEVPAASAGTSGEPSPSIEYISEFSGMAGGYRLEGRIDGGERHRFETEIEGCTEYVFEIDRNGTVEISDTVKTICYGQDG